MMSRPVPLSASRLPDFLKTVAPFSVVDRGRTLAAAGAVTDVSRTDRVVTGDVALSDGEVYRPTVTLGLDGGAALSCRCSTDEELEEQWCDHGVALLEQAAAEGLVEDSAPPEPAAGAAAVSAGGSGHDIAAVIELLKEEADRPADAPRAPPAGVSVSVEHSGDRLGVRVSPGPPAGRPPGPLDAVLGRMLADRGVYDDAAGLWFVSRSDDVEALLALVREYQPVTSLVTGRPLSFSDHLLGARVLVEWREGGALAEMSWVLPDGRTAARTGQLIGTDPYHTVVDDTVYRLSPVAARVARAFPHGSRATLGRAALVPLLEADPRPSAHLVVAGEHLRPAAVVERPEVRLALSSRQGHQEHFMAGAAVEIHGVLEFRYPVPAPGENLVYLPDRQAESDAAARLERLGFRYHADKRRFVAQNDDALDVASAGRGVFPDEWVIEGFEDVAGSLRFAELSVDLSVASAEPGATGRGGDWFDCQLTLKQNNAGVPLSTLFKQARADSDRWVRLDSGAFAKVPSGGIGQLKTVLGMLDPNFKLSNSIRVRLSSAQALGLTAAGDERFRVELDKKIIELRKRLDDFREMPKVKPGKGFKGKLRSYQTEGVSWLRFLYDFELGGVLADEMGLGKTVQTLAFLEHLKTAGPDKTRVKPFLIVAPTSVVTNWCYEARKFTPDFKVLLLQGPQRKRSFPSIPEHDLVVTSYALLRLDRNDLSNYEFSYLVLDEAQNIKNPQAATTKAAKSLGADRRLALSGTPTENRPMELWSIIDFLLPGYLGTYDFFKTYVERPIMESGTAAPVAAFLKSKTKPFILRRTKAEVEKDLPPKIESVLHVEMTASQRELYAQIIDEVRPRVFEAIEQKGVQGASVSILAALLRLRQVCNHPNSISALRALEGFESSKFNLLKDLVTEALEAGRKILVFSQFREMLSIIREWIASTGVGHLYLDGTTKDRQSLIDRFNAEEDLRIFLISLKAGGTGLNLTSADTVIIYDPWWNPAVEGQAVDRAHRIGQTKTVHVYRLVTEHSVEQKIMELKERKSSLVDALVNENGLSTLKLSKEDLDGLFAVPPTEP